MWTPELGEHSGSRARAGAGREEVGGRDSGGPREGLGGGWGWGTGGRSGAPRRAAPRGDRRHSAEMLLRSWRR